MSERGMAAMTGVLLAKAATHKSEKAAQITIQAYKDAKYSSKVMGSKGKWKGKFNPSSISQKASVEYFEDLPIGSSGGDPKFQRSLPKELSFVLLFDNFEDNSTSAYMKIMGMGGTEPKSVMSQVSSFNDVVYTLNGDIHQPNYLEIVFGDHSFNGKVKEMSVDFQEFRTDGEASRAEVKVTFVSAISPDFSKKKNNLNSPDMTHHYLVKEGDTLPLIALRTYGKPNLYLELARVNNLNSFRNLEVGSRLVLPPLNKKG